MVDPARFSLILRKYLKRSPYSYQQLADRADLPKTTISNWANQYVKAPRLWQDLARLLVAMELSRVEADEVMAAANFPAIGELNRSVTNESDRTLLNNWGDDSQTAPFIVPPALPDFVGRHNEIEQIKRQVLKTGEICVLQGMGGIGKSSLATHMAYELRDYFPDGVLWAQLDTAVSADGTLNEARLTFILREFARAYGHKLPATADLTSCSEFVRRILADKRLLLVLDNATHSQEVALFLPPTGMPSIIITTRNRKILGGRYYGLDLQPFAKEEGEALFQEVIGSERLSMSQEAISEILDFTGGVPLALRIVAESLAETEQLTFAEYSSLLRDERTRLEYLEDWEDASKDVRASLALSFKRLPESLQRFFIQLVVFDRNTFTAESVSAVLDAPLTQAKMTLSRLAALCLVEKQDAVEQRFHLHALWRTFALEKVGSIPDQLIDNYIAYFLSFVRANATKGPDAWDRLEVELPNIQLAIERALAMEQSSAVLFFAKYLIQDGEFFNGRGYHREALALLSNLLALQQKTGEMAERPWLHNKMAYFHLILGQHKKSETHARQARQQAKQIGNIEQQADSLLYLGHLSTRTGDNEGALAFFQDELSLRQKLNDEARLANCFNSIGALKLQMGDYPEAEQYLNKARLLFDGLDDKERSARAYANRAVSIMYLGEYEEALADIDRSLELIKGFEHQERWSSEIITNPVWRGPV